MPAELLVSAAATAVLGTTICYGAMPGINWAIWTVVVAAELLTFARRQPDGASRELRAVLAMAVLIGAAAAITADDAALALIFIAVALLLAVASRLAAGVPYEAFGIGALVATPLAAAVSAVVEALARANDAVRAILSEVGSSVVRGLALATPVVIVFAGLLGGADPTLAAWLRALGHALTGGEWVPRAAFGVVLATLSLGTFGLALRPRATRPAAPSATPLVGHTERRIVVDAVIALFAIFLVLQATYLFGHRPQGISYAEYVHRGFAELTIVATLSVALVAALYHGRVRAGIPWEALVLIAQVECLVGSALHRLSLYEGAYGYTALRLWAGAYMLFVGAALGLVAWEISVRGVVDGARLVRRTLALGVLTFTGMVYGNPDAWAIVRNVERYRATGKLDASYLSSVSLDAVPSAIAATAVLPPPCARLVLQALRSRAGRQSRPIGWYEWSARRARAARAARTLTGGGSADGSTPACPMPNA